MELSKTYQLIQNLLVETGKGNIKWQETSDSNIFQTSFPKYSLQITYEERVDAEVQGNTTDYILRLYNNKSVLIEELSDVTILEENRDILRHFDSKLLPYNIMRELYNTARRQAYGTEEAIDNILDHIRSKTSK